MLSHIASDLHQAYLEEVFKPQLGKLGASTPTKPSSPADLDGDGNVDSFEKKVRQFIYDVRHLMRKQNIPVERAFQIRSSKTNYGAEVIKTAKEKLGIKVGVTAPVSEESTGRMVDIVIYYKNGTQDRRQNVSYSQVSEYRAKPTVRSVEVTSNTPTRFSGKLDPVGREDNDPDNDGIPISRDKNDQYIMKRRKAIGNAITQRKSSKKKLKSYGVSEGFSNWRQDLKEVLGVDDEIASRNEKQIKEKKVDNYAGGNESVVKINPEVTEEINILGGNIVESFELSEEYINEVVNIATEFFYNCGLNENGVDIVIEELGEEQFSEFVFELAEEYFLSEELKKSDSKVKRSKAPKGTRQYQTTTARVKKQGGITMSTKSRVGSTIRADRVKKATEKAKEEQKPSSEKSTEGQKTGIFGRLRKGIEAHQKATKETGEVLKKLGSGISQAWQSVADSKLGKAGRVQVKKGLRRQQKAIEKVSPVIGGAAGRAAARVPAIRDTFRAGQKLRSALKEDFDNWVKDLIEEGYDLSNWTIEELYEEYGYLCEKAESQQQQKLFGLALSVKRGETPRSEASPEVLEIVNSMSEKKIRDFAKTKHSGIPHKVDEAIAKVRPGRRSTNTELRQRETVKIQTDNSKKGLGEEMDPQTPRQISAQNQLLRAQKQLSSANQQALQYKKQNQQEPQAQNQSYEYDGNLVDEGTEAAQERRFQKRGERSEGETHTRLIGTATRSIDSLKKRQEKTRPDHPQHQRLQRRIDAMTDRIKKLQNARKNDTSTFRQGSVGSPKP